MLGAGAHAVEPGASILMAGRRESRAGKLFGIEAVRGPLRRITAFGKGTPHRLRSEMAAEAAHVTVRRHGLSPHSAHQHQFFGHGRVADRKSTRLNSSH